MRLRSRGGGWGCACQLFFLSRYASQFFVVVQHDEKMVVMKDEVAKQDLLLVLE